MKIAPIALLFVSFALANSPLPVRADARDRQTIQYHGIRVSDPQGKEGIRNPERGFRYEARIAESKDETWAGRADREEDGRLTLVQCYCYLNDSVGKDISPQKLAQLQASFDTLGRHGMKAVLRFAYESQAGGHDGPTLADIRRHIAQLRPLLVKNAGVILVLQAGMIGLWGEWHHSVHGLDRDVDAQKTLLADLLDALPKDRMVQLRRASYERAIFGDDAMVTAATAHNGSPVSRIGFHHDYFVVRPNSWDTSPGTRDFEQVCSESPYVIVDGEMPWGNEAGGIDGVGAVLRLRIHHYTSFSIVHNNREGGREYSLATWQKTPITADQARARHLPIDDGYFEDDHGQPIARNVFDYVRDHLGYRIELQHADLPREIRPGEPFSAGVTLINRGFAALQNPRQVYFVMIAPDGSRTVEPTDADPRLWQPYRPGDAGFTPLVHEVRLSIPAGIPALRPGRYRIGLWIPDSDPALRGDSRYAVRCANRDVGWVGKTGINVLGTVDVSP